MTSANSKEPWPGQNGHETSLPGGPVCGIFSPAMSPIHQSLKGQLLLDGGKLRGSYFHRGVVLICEHDPEGAFGLLLNRPGETGLVEVFGRELPESMRSRKLFAGGPVQPSALSFLHSDAFLPEANVMQNLSLGHDPNVLFELGESWSASRQLRVFAGYAGWSPGQLDDELRRAAWLTHPASLDLVFHTSPEALWRHVFQVRNNWEERLRAEAPEDLSAN